MSSPNSTVSYSIYDYINSTSERLFSLREHALIGVSPFNGYFTEQNLEKLFSWGVHTFKNIDIFIPNEISAYTFQAIGYSEQRAKQKTKKQDTYLKNKVIKALIKINFSREEAEKKIICFSNIMQNKRYLEVYNICLNLFGNNEAFKNGCLSTSKWVLESKGLIDSISEQEMNIAVKYFLAELPMFIDTPKILNVNSSLFIYKDIPKFLKTIYEDKSLVSQTQGFLAIN